jgi:hypothetical protein
MAFLEFERFEIGCITPDNSHENKHTSAYVSIRQHTSAYVSICQHMSACEFERFEIGLVTPGDRDENLLALHTHKRTHAHTHTHTHTHTCHDVFDCMFSKEDQ